MRAELARLLWAELDEKAAASQLATALWRLRRGAGVAIEDSREDAGLRLVTELSFDRNDLLAASRAGDLERVVELYKGDFFPNFASTGTAAFEAWADLERRYLRTIFEQAALTIGRQHLDHGRHAEAHALALRVCDQAAIHQGGWRLRLEASIAAGPAMAAIAAAEAQRLLDLLAADEVDPEPATRALTRLALGLDAPARPTTARPDEGHSNGAEDARSPLFAAFVAREREFAQVIDAWEQAGAGRGQHVHITGTAGLGKTRLLEQLAARLRASRTRVVLVRANPGARSVSYAFASDIVGALAQRRGAIGIAKGSMAALVALNPTTSGVFDEPADPSVGDEAMRHRIAAVSELLSAVCYERPVALFLDDLHWADPSSRTLLDAVLQQLKDQRLLVVSASREGAPWPTNRPKTQQIQLTAFSVDDVDTLLSTIATLPDDPWAAALPRALHEATQGVPLDVIQTLALLQERGALSISASGWCASDAQMLAATLDQQAAPRRRVEQLPDDERRLLLSMATLGEPASVDLLAASVQLPTDATHGLLAQLQQKGLASAHGANWEPSHDRHAECVLELATSDETRRTTMALGNALVAAGPPDRRALVRAARLLAQGGATDRCADLFERYVRLERLAQSSASDLEVAREFLGVDGSIRPESLVASLPLWIRARLVRPIRQLAAAAAVALLPLAAVASWALRPTVPAADAVVTLMRYGGSPPAWDLIDAPVRLAQTAAGGTIDLNGSARRSERVPFGAYGFSPAPDGVSWASARAVSDSGVIDIYLHRANGDTVRLTFGSGDDHVGSWSPDGRFMVYQSSVRESRSHGNIMLLDVAGRTSRTITATPHGDGSPVWSPDGSRIAFIRQSVGDDSTAWCVMDADGAHLRCELLPFDLHATMLGWRDARNVVLKTASDRAHRLLLLDADRGDTATLAIPIGNGAVSLSPDGRHLLCQCERDGVATSSWSLVPIDEPANLRRLHVTGDTIDGFWLSWAKRSPRAPFVHRLMIGSGLGAPVVGVPYQLQAAGVDSSDRAVSVGVVRWRSLDSTRAHVDSTGILLAHSPGQLRVEASAGGWRRDTIALVVAERGHREVANERWDGQLAPSWRAYGDPAPLTVRDRSLGSALHNNGDGIYYSGVYARQAIDARAGVWLDAQLSTPTTRAQWQEQYVALVAMGDANTLQRWDHRTGLPPVGRSICEFVYPHGDGPSRGDSAGFIARSTGPTIAMPAAVRAGTPYRVTIQLLPDGRCAFAIDGTTRWVSAPVWLDSTARVLLQGSSEGTKMLVGRVQIGTGLAPGLDLTLPSRANPRRREPAVNR